MNPILTKIFGGKASDIVKTVLDGADKLFTSKEEKAQFELDKTKELNRNLEAMMVDATKQLEIEVQDRNGARARESEFVKATGHIDWLMWFLAIAAIVIFGYLVWTLMTREVPAKNELLIVHTLGIVEGIIISIFSYYFGSSAGSRIKDMRGKSS